MNGSNPIQTCGISTVSRLAFTSSIHQGGKDFNDLFEGFAQGRRDALEAVNEHHIIERILKDSERSAREHERFSIKMEGLGEYTPHHLDEEEAQINPMARQLFTAEGEFKLQRKGGNPFWDESLPELEGKEIEA